VSGAQADYKQWGKLDHWRVYTLKRSRRKACTHTHTNGMCRDQAYRGERRCAHACALELHLQKVVSAVGECLPTQRSQQTCKRRPTHGHGVERGCGRREAETERAVSADMTLLIFMSL